jgi:uncharacterized protein (TIGR00290 family)
MTHQPIAAEARSPGRAPVLLSWSGGKDSMLMLHAILQAGNLAPAGLVTTFTEPGDRVATHRVRRELLEAQAAALGLPLHPVLLPPAPPDAIYKERLAAALMAALREGEEAATRNGEKTNRRTRGRAPAVGRVAFGDLFLADLRTWRERHMAELGIEPLFPLWGRDTAALARHFLECGFAATVVALDTDVLPANLAGAPYDAAFLDALPSGVDPCGENGEFHTFVHAGPLFGQPLAVRGGKCRVEGRFAYCDLLPQSAG